MKNEGIFDLPAAAESRPWTRWWWFGGAVDRPTITRLLEAYSDAGLGGVEITSIYGVKGQDSRELDYLSPEWLEMVRHAVAEAGRLGMKVDLPPGSGWRIGGDFLTGEARAARLVFEKDPEGDTRRAECRPSGEKIKRAGRGGGGPAFNPFSPAALESVIEHFEPHFRGLGIRAQFHDSWEYTSDCCPEFFDSFRNRRGYDITEYTEPLSGGGDPDIACRVRYDARLTLAEMALENFIVPWTEWCHRCGQLSRNQAHGSPGNLLDLYAAADIPETEVFGEFTADTPLVSKLASSAAHVAGRPLVSSETGTWLGEHFNVSLADLKQLVDNLFVAGINHHVYHGTAYSPPGAEWPGWLFYAAAQLNPRNPVWRDFHALNAYVTRCQSVLQNGSPDNDLLVYFPIHDLLHAPGEQLARKLTIEADWLEQLPAAETFRELWRRGYAFDYVSDRQLEQLAVEDGLLAAPGGDYRAILVPPCDYLPVATAERLLELARGGARVAFASPMAPDVPGLAQMEKRRARLQELLGEAGAGLDINSALEVLGVKREPMADVPGLNFVRRRHDRGRDYLIANQGCEPVDQWVRTTADFTSALIMDPRSGRTGAAPTRGDEDREVRLRLEPGESLVLRALREEVSPARAWQRPGADATWHRLEGTWRVEFIAGGPHLPPGYKTQELSSWADRGGEAERFAGTARYVMEFDAPGEAGAWELDLGTVHSSARVRLNGEEAGTLIGPSFRTVLPELRPAGNLLEIEVTNLAANRIRDLDRRRVNWRIFEDINFVNRDYAPFDAGNWPLRASGLLGPVRLAALEQDRPAGHARTRTSHLQ